MILVVRYIYVRPTRTRPTRETARGEGSPCMMALLHTRPRAYPKLHLNLQHYSYVSLTNSFNPLALLEFPRARPNDSMHGDVAGGGTGWLCRPPEARAGLADGPTSTYGPSAYTKR